MSYILHGVRLKGKRGDILREAVIQLIVVAIVLGLSVFALDAKASTNGVKQQVLEKELALFIDSSESGYKIEINKKNFDGLVDNVEVRNSRVYVSVNGFAVSDGYPYFSKHKVSVVEEDSKFIVVIK